MIINIKTGRRVLIGAVRIFGVIANLVRAKSIVIENFMSKMPSVVKSTQEVISKSQTSRRAMSNSVHLARRDMGDRVSVMNDSPMIRNGAHNSVSKVNITDSGRAEGVKMNLASADNTVAGKIKSSDSSKSTTQTVTGNVETETRVSSNQTSDLTKQGISNFAVVASEEIQKSLSAFHIGAVVETNTLRESDFFD